MVVTSVCAFTVTWKTLELVTLPFESIAVRVTCSSCWSLAGRFTVPFPSNTAGLSDTQIIDVPFKPKCGNVRLLCNALVSPKFNASLSRITAWTVSSLVARPSLIVPLPNRLTLAQASSTANWDTAFSAWITAFIAESTPTIWKWSLRNSTIYWSRAIISLTLGLNPFSPPSRDWMEAIFTILTWLSLKPPGRIWAKYCNPAIASVIPSKDVELLFNTLPRWNVRLTTSGMSMTCKFSSRASTNLINTWVSSLVEPMSAKGTKTNLS